MQTFSLIFITLLALLTLHCSAPKQHLSKQQIEMCKEIDLNFEPSFRELCGVRKMRFQSYKNLPNQRFLLKPKNSYLVETDGEVELRLPKTAPVTLDSSLATTIDFSPSARTSLLKNKYDYLEKFQPNGRVKMFKLGIPLDSGTIQTFCFTIPIKETHRVKRSVLPNRVIPTPCSTFNTLSAQSQL
ncbi:MAG: hypothetical protein OCD01_14830 [Fibrobacterales bacterium]